MRPRGRTPAPGCGRPLKATPEVGTTDYLISIVLILLVVPQIRGTRQTLRNALLPVVAVAAAAAYHLKSFPTQGHDVQVDVMGVVAGAVLGIACGATTMVMPGTVAVAKAGAVAAVLWIVGMASRAGFEYWATHSGSTTVAQFSRDNLITGSAAWTAALLLMALAQICARRVVGQATVKTHVNRIFAKTGATDSAQAVRYAYRRNLVDSS